MVNNLLIVDTETNGVNSETDSILEIGAILYNVPSRSIIYQLSYLIPGDNKAEDINHIPQAALDSINGQMSEKLPRAFLDMVERSDVLIAHNAEFDKGFLSKSESFKQASAGKPWICTKNDFRWPLDGNVPLNLISIAANMGCVVFNPHRALTDCKLIADCFDKLPDLENRLFEASKPRKWYRASLGYDRRQEAKDSGFTWNGAAKIWIKRMTEEEANQISFLITEIEL